MSDIRLPRPAVRDDFRKRLRAELVNEAVVLAEERRVRRSSLGGRFSLVVFRLRPIAVAIGALAILFAGAGVAAAGSLPGDPAFGLKRAAEEAQLALTPAESKPVVLGELTQRRLDELARTAGRSDQAPTASAEYEAAVKRFAAAVEAVRAAPPGAKRDAVEKLVEAAREKHEQVLVELKDRLPPEAKRGLDRATEQHDKIAPPGRKAGDRGPKPTERPRETERPRASETPRGGRPTVTPAR